LNRVRLDHARQMLVSSAEKTEFIAKACGFRSLNSFWVGFRRAEGISPSRYRQRFRRLL
jgi:AraC family transcriptional regulator, transcriptional activator FtrA